MKREPTKPVLPNEHLRAALRDPTRGTTNALLVVLGTQLSSARWLLAAILAALVLGLLFGWGWLA